jgi:hypothetical protein
MTILNLLCALFLSRMYSRLSALLAPDVKKSNTLHLLETPVASQGHVSCMANGGTY